jgi:hypothetical protein
VTGLNKPHSIARVDGRGLSRAFERAMLEDERSTLHPQALELGRSDRTIAATPVAMWAWVGYGPQPVSSALGW